MLTGHHITTTRQHFLESNKSLCNIARKYQNILIIGDLNLNYDNLKKGDTHSHLSDLCDTFSFSNLVNGVTCVKSQNDTSLDVMLTNRPRSFHNTRLIKTGLSDCHKMIVSVFRAFFKRLPAKVIEYRNYKTFDHNAFLRNLLQELIKRSSYNDEQQYDTFTSIFRKVLDKHGPLKMKKLEESKLNL